MIRKRIALVIGTLALAAVAIPAAASAATVELRSTALGEVLTDSNGFTLFMFSIDQRRTDNCEPIVNCTKVWPPLTVEEAPTAGPGVNASKLKTITLPSGAKQVTYRGHALYGYIGNHGPAETSYVGVFAFQGYWYAVNAQGRRV